MTTTLHFELPPPLLLSLNQRGHWAKTNAARATLRLLGEKAATGLYPYERVLVTARIGWPDRRRRDVHNIVPTLKALIDGITDSGLITDDDDLHLTGPDLRPYHAGIKGVTVIDLDIEPICPECGTTGACDTCRADDLNDIRRDLA